MGTQIPTLNQRLINLAVSIGKEPPGELLAAHEIVLKVRLPGAQQYNPQTNERKYSKSIKPEGEPENARCYKHEEAKARSLGA